MLATLPVQESGDGPPRHVADRTRLGRVAGAWHDDELSMRRPRQLLLRPFERRREVVVPVHEQCPNGDLAAVERRRRRRRPWEALADEPVSGRRLAVEREERAGGHLRNCTAQRGFAAG